MRKQIFALSLLGAVSLTGCIDDNEPDPVNEEELITTVRLTFTGPTGQAEIFSFEDLDGDGPQAPIITSDTLKDSTVYRLGVEFLNATETPPESITAEVLAEGDEHQVFFQVSQSLNLSVSYNDTDVNGAPIGLLNNVITNANSNGTLKVTLRHEPNKSAAGVPNGDISNAGGETDIEVTFNVVIE
jgi:hypothetical protein